MGEPKIKHGGFWADGINSLLLRKPHRTYTNNTTKEEKPEGYYGGTGTIHRTGEVNVELDKDGKVVSVWYRCRTLPFTQNVVSDERAQMMRDTYNGYPAPGIEAVIFQGETGE